MICEAPDKKYLYYLIVSQLQEDGYREQALQLEQAVLNSRGSVSGSDRLGRLFSTCLVSVNEVTSFFNGRETEAAISTPLASSTPSPPAHQQLTAPPPSVTPTTTVTSAPSPPAPTIPPPPDQAPHATLSEQEALESCVQLLSNDPEGALTKESISEVFQIINNLAQLSPPATTNGGQSSEAGGESEMTDLTTTTTTTATTTPVPSITTAASAAAAVSLPEDSLLESIQQTLNGLDSEQGPNSINLAPSLTLTPEMLRLATELATSAGTAPPPPVTDAAPEPVKPFSLADKQLRCSKCDYLTFSKRAFTLHLRSHEEGSDSRSDENERSYKHNYSGNKLVVRPYACKMCKYRAPSRIQLTLHVRTHTGEKPHRCPYCEYKTAQKGNLKKHIEFRHARTDENLHCCTLCQYKTSSKMALSSHITQSHKDVANKEAEMEKRYQCKHCEFKCVWVGSLRSHMFDKHPEMMERSGRTDPPEHKCPLCPYTSQWRGNLKTHMLRKHSEPQPVDGFFHCKRCTYKCASNEELSAHYDGHLSDERPFQCPLCDYRAGLKNTLDTHMKYKHSDEKPFGCDVCSYRCVTKGQLTIHQRKHTGERPYKCPYCPYDTAQQSNLKSHVRHRHPNQNQHIFTSKRGRKRKYPLYPDSLLASISDQTSASSPGITLSPGDFQSLQDTYNVSMCPSRDIISLYGGPAGGGGGNMANGVTAMESSEGGGGGGVKVEPVEPIPGTSFQDTEVMVPATSGEN